MANIITKTYHPFNPTYTFGNTLNYASPNVIMSATVNRTSGIFDVSTAITVRKISFNIYSFTTQGADLAVGIRAVSSVTGQPTEDGASAWLGATNNGYGTVAVTGTGIYTVTLTEDVALSASTRYAVCFVGNATQLYDFGCGNAISSYPYVCYGGATWGTKTYNRVIPNVYIHNTSDVVSLIRSSQTVCLDESTIGLDSVTNPNMAGNRITAPWTGYIDGLWAIADFNTTEGSLILKNSGGTTLASCAFDEDVIGQSFGGLNMFSIDTPVLITANDDLYLYYEPTIDATPSQLLICTYASTTQKSELIPQGNASKITRYNTDAWTQTDTAVIAIGVRYSEFVIPTGSGGAYAFSS